MAETLHRGECPVVERIVRQKLMWADITDEVGSVTDRFEDIRRAVARLTATTGELIFENNRLYSRSDPEASVYIPSGTAFRMEDGVLRLEFDEADEWQGLGYVTEEEVMSDWQRELIEDLY